MLYVSEVHVHINSLDSATLYNHWMTATHHFNTGAMVFKITALLPTEFSPEPLSVFNVFLFH